jgi:hypothetical protein
MNRNKFCTNIENIIKDNISLMSRYVSHENSLIEDLFMNICNIYFNNDPNELNKFVDNYLKEYTYEKYNYTDKMIDIVKYIISYHIHKELIKHNNLTNISIKDINKFYEFKLVRIDEFDHYSDKSYPKIHFILNNPEILDILNKYIDSNYKINSSGLILLNDNSSNLLTNIYNCNADLNALEFTRYILDITSYINIVKTNITNNINKILKK